MVAEVGVCKPFHICNERSVEAVVSMMSGSGSYKLRCNLLGHSKDVRAVATSHDGLVVTASRDATARLWAPAAAG